MKKPGWLDEFKVFISRGSVIDLAVGGVVGGAFTAIGGFLTGQHADNAYAMVGYRLHNAMTEHGSVARGVCELRDGYLTGLTERTHIEQRGADAAYTEDGEHFIDLPGDTTVSMNFWGFAPSIFPALREYFENFLRTEAGENIKAECLLPVMVGDQLQKGALEVSVLHSADKWFGMTYHEDREIVAEELRKLHARGDYPESLRV